MYVCVRLCVFVCVCFRFWNSIQMDAGKAVSMTTGQEMTAWATSPQTWWRSSRGQVCHHTPQTRTHTHTHTTHTHTHTHHTHTHTHHTHTETDRHGLTCHVQISE